MNSNFTPQADARASIVPCLFPAARAVVRRCWSDEEVCRSEVSQSRGDDVRPMQIVVRVHEAYKVGRLREPPNHLRRET